MSYYQTLKEILWNLKREKLKKLQKFSKNLNKLEKLLSFCVFVFVVQKYIAHKIVIKSNFVSQKAFINFLKLQPKTNQTKKLKKSNIAGRLPENSRNRFVDRQSKKNSKKDRPKKFVFSLKADLLYLDQKSV